MEICFCLFDDLEDIVLKAKPWLGPVMCRLIDVPLTKMDGGVGLYKYVKNTKVQKLKIPHPQKKLPEFMFRVCLKIGFKMSKCHWNLNNHATIFFFKSSLS